MTMNTNLRGRLRNTTLPANQGLLPVFEAVVNSIQAIEATQGQGDPTITVEIHRSPQTEIALADGRAKKGAPPSEPIVGFTVIDEGIGFDDENFRSFETLDTDFKASKGCRGVGRLLWLKAFSSVEVTSTYLDSSGDPLTRTFTFDAQRGVVAQAPTKADPGTARKTRVTLQAFKEDFRDRAAKTGHRIAAELFEHCIWYFVRAGGAPRLLVRDGEEIIALEEIYDEYMVSSAHMEKLSLKDQKFEITHLRLKASLAKEAFIAWGAAGRVVQMEGIAARIPGLHGRLRDGDTEFLYAAYVTSEYLDQAVRAERTGFDLRNDLFQDQKISMSELREAVLAASRNHLRHFLEANQQASRERVTTFVDTRAPRYRPVLDRMDPDRLSISPDISDRELDLLLHKELAVIEGELLSEGHSIMEVGDDETAAKYRERLANYLKRVDDIKKSDLANYVFHRKVVLDLLEKAIQKGPDGRYVREEVIHELIIPLRKTSNEIHPDGANLWLIDERLAFHNFLASDKTLASMPITGALERSEPDICALNVYDEPLLIAEGAKLPLASLVVVEIKRPMRNDASSGEDKDPIEQALGYLERVRSGGAQTSTGRLIPQSKDIPGFCYIICDLTPSVEKRCKQASLRVTSDKQGYFGYNENYKAYIEVLSFDKLVNAARERNRAFFDKLGLPNN